MASWREHVSVEAQADLDALLDAALSTAGQSVQDSGTFSPFAVVCAGDGVVSLAGVSHGEERLEGDTVIAQLWGVLQDQRDELRAVTVVSDRRLGGEDQIAVQLEHREGTALEVTMPYQVVSAVFQPGALRAAVGPSRVW